MENIICTQHNTTQHNTTQHNTTQHIKFKYFIYLLILFTTIVSCKNNVLSNDDNIFIPNNSNIVSGGLGGNQTVGKDYKLPEGSLSQEEQKRDYDPNDNSITLFKKGSFNSKFYRMPSLVVTKKGTILAAADRRRDSVIDLGREPKGPIDIIVRRSEDLGKTWSSPIFIDNEATEPKDSYGDAFMVNGHDGSVVLAIVTYPGVISLKNDRKADTIFYKSTDDGRSWNKVHSYQPTDFNSNADKGFIASGQGLTLRYGNNKDKLFAPYFQYNKKGGVSISSLISSDNGNTWTCVGNTIPTDGNLDETKSIELSDGRIMLNHRRRVNTGGRSWSISSDGGRNWTYQGVDPEVVDPGNNADLVRYEFNGKYIKTSKYILLIHANSKHNGKWFTARKNHHIKLTVNEFNNGQGASSGKYKYDKQLVNNGENLYSGYPTITVLPDGTIATLTEETWKSDNGPTYKKGNKGEMIHPGGDDYDIVFRRFNLYWLTAGQEYVDYSKDNLFQSHNSF